MKVCIACQKLLSHSNFYKRNTGQYYTKCKNCYNQDKRTRSISRSRQSVATKDCRVCGVTKDSSEFHKNYSQAGGVASICKNCAYLANLETKYKITDIYSLMDERDHKCEVCSRDYGSKPYVDHDHSCCPTDYTCGKCFRGLLCSSCNMGLGHFADSTTSLSNAVSYLNAYNGVF